MWVSLVSYLSWIGNTKKSRTISIRMVYAKLLLLKLFSEYDNVNGSV